MKTCPCNIQSFFFFKNPVEFFSIFFLFLLTLEPSTHNLCFGAKIRKIGIPLQTPVFIIKVGFKGVYMFFSWTCFPDEERCGIDSGRVPDW